MVKNLMFPLLCLVPLTGAIISKQGQSFVVNDAVGNQIKPSVAGLGPSPFEITGFVAVWEGQWTDSTEGSIYGQMFTLDMQKSGAVFKVNAFTTGRQTDPSVSGLASGGFVVAWTSPDQDGSGLGVYAQIYDSTGAVVKSEFLVNTNTAGDQSAPTVQALQTGFVIAWQDSQKSGSGIDVYARVYTDAGAGGADFLVNQGIANNQYGPDAALLMDGRFIIAWTSQIQDGNGNGVYSRLFNANGSPNGTDTRVNTYTVGNQQAPSVTGLSTGGYVVAWASNQYVGLGVFGQVYLSTASPDINKEFQINTYTDKDQYDVDLIGLKDGGFVATWTSQDQDGSGNGVYGRGYNNTNGADGDEFIIPTNTTGNQQESTGIPLPSGGFLVLWSTQVGQIYNVNGQEFTVGGTLAPTPAPPTPAPPTPSPATGAPDTPTPTTVAPMAPITAVPTMSPVGVVTDQPTLVPGGTAEPTGLPNDLGTAIPTGVPTLVPGTTASPATPMPPTLAPGTTAVPGTPMPPTLTPGTTAVPTPAPSSSSSGLSTAVIVVIVVAAVAVVALAAGGFYFTKKRSNFNDFANPDITAEMNPQHAHAPQDAVNDGTITQSI